MIIQFNSKNNVTESEELRSRLTDMISGELDRYSNQITRVEVHLGDEDGMKENPNDKRCTLEVRPAGLKPIAVTDNADTFEQAASGAVDKLKSSLETTLGRLRKY